MNSSGQKKSVAEFIIDQFALGVSEALQAGDDVKVPGLGTFKVKETKARTARNPKTGETIQVPAKKVVKFVPAKELKSRVQEGE